ncbi:MAG: hypothetical protein ABI488_14800 [Polyangiaceae bacterium]
MASVGRGVLARAVQSASVMYIDLLPPARQDAPEPEIAASLLSSCPALPSGILPSRWSKVRKRADSPSNIKVDELLEHVTALLDSGAVEGSRADLAQSWRDIVAGRMRVQAGLCAAGRAYLVLSEVPGASARLPAHGIEVLERMLLGDRQKVPAIELSLSTSSVSLLLRDTLVGLGVSCSPSRVPLLLVMLAHAARGIAGEHATASRIQHGSREYLLIGANFPGIGAFRELSPALREVVSMRLAGKTHAEIAAWRKTSRRTVANQMAVAFQRFRVSSRLELAKYLATARRSPRLREGVRVLALRAPNTVIRPKSGLRRSRNPQRLWPAPAFAERRHRRALRVR